MIELQGGAKNGATLSHCKYSENFMTELLCDAQIYLYNVNKRQ